MASVPRGWAIGYLPGHTINRQREARPRWAAVAYSHPSDMAWSYNHRSAHAAEHAALTRCPGPQARPCACRTNITIAVARGPRGAMPATGPTPTFPTTPGSLPSHLPTR